MASAGVPQRYLSSDLRGKKSLHLSCGSAGTNN